MATNDIPPLAWSFVDMLTSASGGWTFDLPSANVTVGSRFSLYKRGYNRAIRATGIKFHFLNTVPASVVKVALWREAVAGALVSKTFEVLATGTQIVLFDTPYTFVDADYYRVLKASIHNDEAPEYTAAIFNAGAYQGEPTYPFLSSANVMWYAGRGVRSVGDANPTTLDPSDYRFPVEPVLEYV